MTSDDYDELAPYFMDIFNSKCEEFLLNVEKDSDYFYKILEDRESYFSVDYDEIKILTHIYKEKYKEALDLILQYESEGRDPTIHTLYRDLKEYLNGKIKNS